MVEPARLNIVQNGPVLLFHEVYNPLREVGAAKMGIIEGFAGGEKLAGFVDKGFDVTGSRPDVLSLDIKDSALMADLVTQAFHDALLYSPLWTIFQAPRGNFVPPPARFDIRGQNGIIGRLFEGIK